MLNRQKVPLFIQKSTLACMETHAGTKWLPDIGPKWEILPNQGRGSEPGSKIDIIRFDFFLLSAWEYNIPYHSALRKKASLAQAV